MWFGFSGFTATAISLSGAQSWPNSSVLQLMSTTEVGFPLLLQRNRSICVFERFPPVFPGLSVPTIPSTLGRTTMCAAEYGRSAPIAEVASVAASSAPTASAPASLRLPIPVPPSSSSPPSDLRLGEYRFPGPSRAGGVTGGIPPCGLRCGTRSPVSFGPRSHARPEHEQPGHYDKCDVHGRAPGHHTVLDDVSADRKGGKPKSAPAGAFHISSAPAPTGDPRSRDHRHAVLLVGIAENALDRHRVARSLNRLHNLHGI